MLQAKECAPTLSPFVVFTFRLAVESINELRGASYTQHHLPTFQMKKTMIILME
jgi:hypothetical protein